MKIAPVSFAIPKNNIKSFNNNAISFASLNYDEYYVTHTDKMEKAQQYYRQTVIPKSQKAKKNIEIQLDEAKNLYDIGKHLGFKSFSDGKHSYVYKRKLKGLSLNTVIEIFEDNTLKKEVEIFPKIKVKIKEYKDGNKFDMYECNNILQEKKYCENVTETKANSKRTFDADKIYTFQNDLFVSYKEGYHYKNQGRNSRELNIGICIQVDNDKECTRYLEGVHNDFGLIPVPADFSTYVN